jgi:hypothetical protein
VGLVHGAAEGCGDTYRLTLSLALFGADAVQQPLLARKWTPFCARLPFPRD